MDEIDRLQREAENACSAGRMTKTKLKQITVELRDRRYEFGIQNQLTAILEGPKNDWKAEAVAGILADLGANLQGVSSMVGFARSTAKTGLSNDTRETVISQLTTQLADESISARVGR